VHGMKACATVDVQPNSGNSSLDEGVSGNIHAAVTSPPPPPGKEPPVPLEYEDEWEPDAVWTLWKTESSLFSAKSRTTIP
jgi:hypothetical protein